MSLAGVLTKVAILLIPAAFGFSSFTPVKPPSFIPKSGGEAPNNEDAAKTTWERVALASPEEIDSVQTIDMKVQARIIHPERYEEFKKLKGTYFINGLSTGRVGDRLIHPFEAHGFVKSLRFDGESSLVMKTAIVETPLTKAERWLNTPLARGGMSQLSNPIFNALSSTTRDTANLAVTLWPPPGHVVESVLIAGGDNGSPHRLDPNTLATLGKLEEIVPELKGKSMLAHTRIDHTRQRLILCSSRFDTSDKSHLGGASTVIEFMEFDTDFKMVSSREYTMRFAIVHDWMLTEDFYVVPKNPAQFEWDRLPEFLLGRRRAVEVFRMDEDAVGEIVLIPRHDGNAVPLEYKADSFFNLFHFGPCSQDDNEKTVTIYGAVFDHYTFGSEMGFDVVTQSFDPTRWCTSGMAPAPRLDKFRVNVEDPNLVLERTRTPLMDGQTDVPLDMPTFDGSRYVYFLGAARSVGWFPFRSVVKMDTLEGRSWNWDAGDACVVSEPMFLPSASGSGEDDGFVIAIVHNAAENQSDLVVFDSRHFEAGPICVLPLGRLMPWCVHGFWQEGF